MFPRRECSQTFGFLKSLNAIVARTGGFRLRLSRRNISPDHIQVVSCSFERLLRIVVRNKSRVIVKGQIAFASEAIKDGQQTGVFLVDARPHKVDDGDVVSSLAPCTESMAEHKAERSL